MDRQIIYYGAVPLDTDLLNVQRDTLLGLGYLAQDIFGANTSVSGLACTATSPATFSVTLGAGRIYSLQNVDNTAFGNPGLPADTTHTVLKQGILYNAITLACPAPTTPGYSICYLIEVTYQDLDTTDLVLPYYNAANPGTPLLGPGGNNTAQPTQRQGQLLAQAKAGIAAPTGSQAIPSADAGYTGLYVVTVPYGASAVVSGDIALLPGAPFISNALGNIQFSSLSGKPTTIEGYGITDAIVQNVGGSTSNFQFVVGGLGSSSYFLSGANPLFSWQLTTAAANNGLWQTTIGPTSWNLWAVADNQGSAVGAITITRSGVSITGIALGGLWQSGATQPVGTNNNYLATTAFVAATLAASPTLGGNPTAPTQSTGTENTTIANTLFVQNTLQSYVQGLGYPIIGYVAADVVVGTSTTTILSGIGLSTYNLVPGATYAAEFDSEWVTSSAGAFTTTITSDEGGTITPKGGGNNSIVNTSNAVNVSYGNLASNSGDTQIYASATQHAILRGVFTVPAGCLSVSLKMSLASGTVTVKAGSFIRLTRLA